MTAAQKVSTCWDPEQSDKNHPALSIADKPRWDSFCGQSDKNHPALSLADKPRWDSFCFLVLPWVPSLAKTIRLQWGYSCLTSPVHFHCFSHSFLCKSLTISKLFFTDIASDWIVFLLSCLQDIPSQPIRASDFRFDGSTASAEHNASVLAFHDHDLALAIQSQLDTPVFPGSEFKPVFILEWLCAPHPLWCTLRDYLSNGVSYPMLPLSEIDRRKTLQHALSRGNHSSIRNHAKIVQQSINDDVLRGYVLPLPRAAIELLHHAELAPLGVVEQTTINEHHTEIS